MAAPNEIRERFRAAVARGDVAGVTACYRPDAVLIAPEGRFEGHDRVGSYYRIQFDAFTGISLEPAATFDSGDTAVSEWSFRGTHTGTLALPDGAAVAATGKQVSQRGADVALIAGGLIAEHRVYYDQLELMEQLGLLAVGEGERHV